MKKQLLYPLMIIGLILTTNCSHLSRTPNSVPSTEDYMKIEVEQLQTLIEEALVWRSQVVEFKNKNEKKFTSDNFTHSDLQFIYQSGLNYLELRKKIFLYVYNYDDLKSADSELLYDSTRPTQIIKTNSNSIQARVNPKDKEGQQFLIRLKIAYSAALIMYDNYLMGVYPYSQNSKIRYRLKYDVDRNFSNKLEEISNSFFNNEQRQRMSYIAKFLSHEMKNLHTNKSPNHQYLDEVIAQSSFYSFLLKDIDGLEAAGPIRSFIQNIKDRFTFIKRASTYALSKVFGNGMGLVQFRSGYMKNLSDQEKMKITEKLQPLDILLEKTPFRLTDKFIPGYYGHVAVWVGTEKDLKEMGIWNEPIVRKYHDQIKRGHHIIEALRPGVQINTLSHFLDIDDLLALRHTTLNKEQRKEFLLRAFEQVGKEYDFNFDVETDKRIVCSEIAYVVYHDINWPTDKSLGRWTISPDHVAWQAIKGPLRPVVIYKNGKEVTGDLDLELKSLLTGPEGLSDFK